MNDDTLAQADIEYLRGLRERGFAVCIFTPKELEHSNREGVEDIMCSAGNLCIDLDKAQEEA